MIYSINKRMINQCSCGNEYSIAVYFCSECNAYHELNLLESIPEEDEDEYSFDSWSQSDEPIKN